MIALCFHTFAFALFPFASPPFLPTLSPYFLASCIFVRFPRYCHRTCDRNNVIKNKINFISIRFTRIDLVNWMILHRLHYSTFEFKTLESRRCNNSSNLSKVNIFFILFANIFFITCLIIYTSCSFLPFVFQAFVVILSLSRNIRFLIPVPVPELFPR